MTHPAVQCTAVTVVQGPYGPEGHALCELADGHAGEHADCLWEADELWPAGQGGAFWYLWSAGDRRTRALPWCRADDTDDMACTLARDHPGPHSWQIHDPLHDALNAIARAAVEGWGP